MGKFKDLTGMRFGRLTALELVDDYVAPNGRRRKQYRCVCDCGNEKIVLGENLSAGYTLSCGCLQKERALEANKVHGDTDSRLYGIWCAMKRRCYRPYEPKYSNYGGRGIVMCEEWKNNYEAFRTWAMTHGYDPLAERGECTIDRIDVNGNYCPENCRWVNMQVQMNNLRTNRRIEYNNETHTMAEWARFLDLPYAKLQSKLKKYDYNMEKALAALSN